MIKHFVVSTIIVSKIMGEWKVLLLQHKKLGKWVIPGGHIEINETPIEAAKREVFEETSINDLEFISFLHNEAMNFEDAFYQLPPEYCYIENIPENSKENKHQHIDLIYIAETKHADFIMNDKESLDIGWYSSYELNNLDAFPMTKFHANQILNILNS